MTKLQTILDKHRIFINNKNDDVRNKSAEDFIAKKTQTCALMDAHPL